MYNISLKKTLITIFILFFSSKILYANNILKYSMIEDNDKIEYYNNYLKSVKHFIPFLERKDNNIDYKIAKSFFYIKNYFLASDIFLKYYNENKSIDTLSKYIYCYYLSLSRYNMDNSHINYLINRLIEYKNIYPSNNYLLEIEYLISKLNNNIIIKNFEQAKYLYNQNNYKNSLFAFSNFIEENRDSDLVEEALFYLIKSQFNLYGDVILGKDYFLIRNHTKNLIKLCLNFIKKFPNSKYRNTIYIIYETIINNNINNIIENDSLFFNKLMFYGYK